MTSQAVRLIEGGKLTIPAAYRRALGIGTGDAVVVELAEGELRIRPLSAAIKETQAIVSSFIPGDRRLAEELIAERRADAGRRGPPRVCAPPRIEPGRGSRDPGVTINIAVIR